MLLSPTVPLKKKVGEEFLSWYERKVLNFIYKESNNKMSNKNKKWRNIQILKQ